MLGFISDIDGKVDVLLKEKCVASRVKASAGVLVSVLLPACVLKAEYKSFIFHDDVIKLWTPLSVGLLVHSCLNILYLRRNVAIYNGLALIPSVLITSLLTYSSFYQGTGWRVVLNCCLLVGYEYGVLYLMRLCPRAFTYGESCCVVQASVLFLSSCFHLPLLPVSCLHQAAVILKVGVVCVFGISVASLTCDTDSKLLLFSSLVLGSVLLILVPVLQSVLATNPFLWIYLLITSDYNTLVVFCYWAVLSVAGTGVVVYVVYRQEKANTMERKVFHVLVLLVYLPGLLVNPCLLYLASGVVFALFILIDVMRILKLPYVGTGLAEGFALLSDEKDQGGLSLTPLYLVAGCSLPLWLHPHPTPTHLLPLISGLLTVAVGDTCASVCGSLFGTNKWSGSNKTKEGTIACFLSQLFFFIALIHFGYLPRKDLIRPFLAIGLTSVVEARTSQVDNLVLPLLMYLIVV